MSWYKSGYMSKGFSGLAVGAAAVGGVAIGAIVTHVLVAPTPVRNRKEAEDLGFEYAKQGVLIGRAEQRAALENEVSPEEIQGAMNNAIARAKIRKAKSLSAEA